MHVRRVLIPGMLGVCGILALAGTAAASNLAPDCQLVANGTTGTVTQISCPSPSNGPGTYSIADSFTSPAGTGSVSSTPIAGPNGTSMGTAGFVDDYLFNVPQSSTDAATVSISNGTTDAIGGLFATLYSLDSNPGGLALQPQGAIYGTVNSSSILTTVTINPVTLATGNYVLQISGTVTGSAGGSYGGTVNFTPVPLPPTLPLLLSALVGLAGFALANGNLARARRC